MNEHYPFITPPLPYPYEALEPYISAQTLYLHHDMILKRYIQNLNTILNNYPELQNKSLEELISNPENLPPEIRQFVIENAGGAYNHIIYFNSMTYPTEHYPTTYLYPAIARDFGTVEHFFDEFKRKAVSVFGIGYAWLVTDSSGHLQIVTTTGENSPVTDGLCVLAGIDLWEHSYYLDHFTNRNSYIEDWFLVLNWQEADERLKNCISAP